MSRPSNRQLTLNLFIYPGGHHEAAWRHPSSDARRLLDITYYQELARQAEAAKLDAVFLADGPSLPENVRYASRFRLEPITLLTGVATATERIGLIATASTTYLEPYNLARLFASLDHISRGRAGWNIVTTGASQAAANFGLETHPVHADRYARAREFLEAVTALWDSWEDDALVIDRESGIFADTSKIHRIDHAGALLRVAGPLNVPRSPQGRPVYVQAGSSKDGRAFAAAYAEAIFTAHQTLGDARDFYADIKARVKSEGRDPDQVRVLPGISPFIGSTEAEALELQEEFDELIQPEYSLHQLDQLLGVDLRGYDLDGPFPADVLPTTGDRQESSRFKLVADIVRREAPTIRQLLRRLAGARGHWVTAGAPEQIADRIEEWFTGSAADGFNIMPPYLPGGFDAFTGHVVPILRKRGLFRTEYEGSTLREHYGLQRPPSRFGAALRGAENRW
ncbi:LLM class flavin-dependent oxidoreductase [Spongiactinospora sp. 9N601]|uniref:LLM class flavin-dependent oxidoreductase n=1 Tax=Spongiactinospora sp. 9N601 TaxID=3375149 RepID=UPI0037BBECC1